MSLSAVPAGVTGVATGRPRSLALAANARNCDTCCDDEDAAAPCEDEDAATVAPLYFGAGLITNVPVRATACDGGVVPS